MIKDYILPFFGGLSLGTGLVVLADLDNPFPELQLGVLMVLGGLIVMVTSLKEEDE